jgi:hypothetical protein
MQRLQSSRRVAQWDVVRLHEGHRKRTRRSQILLGYALGYSIMLDLTERVLRNFRRLEFSHCATVGDFHDCRALLGK